MTIDSLWTGLRVWVSWIAVLAISIHCGSVRARPGEEEVDPDGAPGSDDPPGRIDGGSSEDDAGTPPTAEVWFVDAVAGDDANDGMAANAAFRTISHAVAFADAGDVIQTAPGTYDVALGETFPIALPPGVTLRGDEANRGADAVIAGNGSSGNFGTAIDFGQGSTLAGFRIRVGASGANFPTSLYIAASAVTVRNCTIADEPANAIVVDVPSTGLTIRDNLLLRNRNIGIYFLAGFDSRIERNQIRENELGVAYDNIGGDLGGGPAASAGENAIACNRVADLYTTLSPSQTITAASNAWDHVPPAGDDISNENSAVIDVANATLAADPCP